MEPEDVYNCFGLKCKNLDSSIVDKRMTSKRFQSIEFVLFTWGQNKTKRAEPRARNKSASKWVETKCHSNTLITLTMKTCFVKMNLKNVHNNAPVMNQIKCNEVILFRHNLKWLLIIATKLEFGPKELIAFMKQHITMWKMKRATWWRVIIQRWLQLQMKKFRTVHAVTLWTNTRI